MKPKSLEQWAIDWGVPPAALIDLAYSCCHYSERPRAPNPKSEAAVHYEVRLEYARAGIHAWRNNNGAGFMRDGSFIRWGLANESPELNKILKSSDVLGFRPTLITQEMVGTTIAKFFARELKHSEWVYSDTDEERAQLRFITLVQRNGGDAKFATGTGSL